MAKSIADVMQMVSDNEVKFVDFRFTDTRGKEQHVTVPVSHFDEDKFASGHAFDGSSVAGWKGIEASDMLLIPDAATAQIDPFFEETTLFMSCDVIEPSDGKSYDRDPRSIAKRAEAYLKASGLGDTAFFGPEPEFFVFDGVRWNNDMGGCGYQIDEYEASWNSGSKLEGGNRGSFQSRSAHYHCELAAQALHTSQPDQAKQHLEIAKTLSPQAARPSIALANVYAAAGDDDKALTLLLNLANATPHIVPLLCTQLVQLANKCQAQDRVLALLQFADNVAPSIDVTQAMSALQPQATTALFESHLSRQASLAAVAYVLADNNRTHTETTEALTKAMTSAITKAAAPLTRYRCAACGFEAKTYFWQCPGCQGWETFPARRVEEL